MAAHNELGTNGEDIATNHLLQHGYTILDRNWAFGKEEIDIIASKDQFLVIVEVKTRASDFFGEPHRFVSASKQKHLIRAAHAYVQKHDITMEVRMDVIGVILNKREQRLQHIENAFQPGW